MKKQRVPLFQTVLRMFKELRGYRGALLLTLALLAAASVLETLGSYQLGQFTDIVLQDLSQLKLAELFLLLGLLAAALLVGVASRALWGRLHQRIGYDFRKRMVEKLGRIEYAWFEKNQSGDVVTRVNTDLTQLLALYDRFRNIGAALLLGAASLVCMLFIQPLLAVLYLALPVFTQWFIFHSSQKMDPDFRKRQQLYGGMAAVAQEALSGAPEVKAMSYEKNLIGRFAERVHTYTDHVIHLDRASSRNDTFLGTLGGLQSLALIILGGLMVFQGWMTIGDLLAAQMLSGNISKAVSALNFFQLRMEMASAPRVFEILDAPEVREEPKTSREVPLSAQGLAFSYPQRPDVAALSGVSFSVERGQRVAFVGPSGSGKSTILKLIAGLYQPSAGLLERDSQTGIALMQQDAFLFEDTLYHNIACGDAEALLKGDPELEQRVAQAARAAEMEEFILSLPQGYQSDCAEGGRNLSGGQKQRLSMARALCRDAGLVLLDEPTASLDPATAEAVMENLLAAFEGKTLVMVTHDLSLVRTFDRIYVLDNGRIAEEGDHQALIQAGGLYCRLLKEGVER